MFGKLRPAIDRLSTSERREYAHWYCNLCGALSADYGAPSRLLVVHDVVSLAWLLSAPGGQPLPLSTGNCLRGGVRRAKASGLPDLSTYLAAISAFMLGVKAQDDRNDGGSWLASAGNSLFKRPFAQSKIQLQSLGARTIALEQALARQVELEIRQETQLEATSEPTGAAYAAVAMDLAEIGDMPIKGAEAAKVGDALGRAVYVLDAIRDFGADQGKNYNPLCIQAGKSAHVLPTDLLQAATSFIESRLVGASGVFRPMPLSFQRRWNSIAERLSASYRGPKASVTLFATCFIPCGDGCISMESEECSKLVGVCMCCWCCGTMACTR